MKRLIVLFLGFLSYISLNAQDYVTVSSLLFENQYYTITLTNNRINNYDLYVEYFFTYNGERIGTIHRANIPSGKKSCTEMLVGYTEKQNAWMSKIPRGEENNVGITILFVGKREGKLYTSTGSGNGIRHTTNNSQRYSQITTQNKGSNQAYNTNNNRNTNTNTNVNTNTNNISIQINNGGNNSVNTNEKRMELSAISSNKMYQIYFRKDGYILFCDYNRQIDSEGTYTIGSNNTIYIRWNNGYEETAQLRYQSSTMAIVYYQNFVMYQERD